MKSWAVLTHMHFIDLTVYGHCEASKEKKQLFSVTSCSLAGFRPNFSFSTCRAGQSLMRMSISRTIMHHCLKNSLISSWLWILIILDLDKISRHIWRFANKPDMDSTMSRSNANPLFCLGVCRWGVRVHIDRETQFVGQFLASFPWEAINYPFIYIYIILQWGCYTISKWL